MARRPRKYGADAAADASTQTLFGRNRGKSAQRMPVSGERLQTQGPIVSDVTLAGPMGMSFRNNEAYIENTDRLQVMVQTYRLSLRGYHHLAANGSTLPANSALTWLDTYFWPQYYPMLWHMAQRRDGYRATAAPPLGTPEVPREIYELAITAQINARIVNAVYAATLVNAGMRTMLTGFNDINPDRIVRALERTDKFIYPQFLAPLVEYWSQIFTPYVGGPVVIPLFDFQAIEDELAPGVGAYTAWAGAIPNLNVAADITALLDDIDLACTQILDYNLGVGDIDDWLNLHSQFDMLGLGAPAPSKPLLKVDPLLWTERYLVDAFYFSDSKGIGADTNTFWPDYGGSEDTMISINLVPGFHPSPDDLYWVGGKGIYAFEADDSATPGYCAASEDFTALGMVLRVSNSAVVNDIYSRPTDVYTRGGGWAIIGEVIDVTAAALQEYLWRFPWITQHPESWRVILGEEAEESYHHGLRLPTVQLPVGTYARVFREWLIKGSGLPFTV